mgnify:CR=1 FL=1|tara:strand:- start:222 stop:461 length:240 start_codon:yes stop_codon:yes gene_type:complete
MNEKMSKDSRFKKLAKNRVNSATSYLRLIGNLANKSHYEYTEAEVRKIILHLRNELDRLQAKFKAEKRTNTREEFDFDG